MGINADVYAVIVLIRLSRMFVLNKQTNIFLCVCVNLFNLNVVVNCQWGSDSRVTSEGSEVEQVSGGSIPAPPVCMSSIFGQVTDLKNRMNINKEHLRKGVLWLLWQL